MSRSDGEGDASEPVTVTDKRRIDPVTFEVRDPAAAGTQDGASDVAAGEASAAEPVAVEPDAVAELTADLQRVQADFANYRRRAQREQQAAADRAKASTVGALLTVLDDLDRARSHGDLDSGPLKSVADKLVTVLTGLGLTAFGEEGDAFDPALHEAVQHEGDGSAPVLGTVMRRGYRLGEQVLRSAMVGVVDAPAGPGAPDTPGAPAAGDTPVTGGDEGAAAS